MFKIVNSKQMPMMLLAVLCVAITVPIRVFEMQGNYDTSSGFYKEFGTMEIVFYVVLFLSCVSFFLYNVFNRRRVQPYAKSRSRAIAVSGILFALAMIYNFIFIMLKLFGKTSLAIGEVAMNLTSADSIICIIQAVFSLMAAFYIIIHAFAYFGGTINYRPFKLIGLLPALWLASRLVRDFLYEINYKYVSQIFLEMLMLIFAVMFFFNFAKMNACFKNGIKYSQLFFSGWCCVVLCAVVSIPQIVMSVMGNSDVANLATAPAVVDLAMGFYVFVILMKCSVVKINKKNR